MNSEVAMSPVRARFLAMAPRVLARPVRSSLGFGGVVMRSSTFTKHSM